MKKREIIVLLGFLLAARVSFSQKVSEDLLKVRKVYQDAENFSADVTVTGYETKENTKPVQIGSGILRKTKTDYYSKFAADEMITNEKHTIIVNHTNKTIKLLDASTFSQMNKSRELFNLDSLLAAGDS